MAMKREPLNPQTVEKITRFLTTKAKDWSLLGLTYPLTLESFENDIVATAFLATALGEKKK
jgi:hypothetical protein